MDTKLKNNKIIWKPVLLVLFCVMVTLAAYLAAGNGNNSAVEVTESADTSDNGLEQSWPNYSRDVETDLKSFIRYMYVGSYGMYWNLMQAENQKEVLSPQNVFLPAYSGKGTASSEEEDTPVYYFDEEFRSWFQAFTSLIQSYEVYYKIVDNANDISYSDAPEDVEVYKGIESARFFMELDFDENGNLSLSKMVNKDQITLTTGEVGGMTKDRFLEWIGIEDVSTALLETPKNVTIYLYSNNSDCYHSVNPEIVYEVWDSSTARAIRPIYLLMLGLLLGCALLLPVFKRLRREEELVQRLPLEAALAGALLAAVMENGCESLYLAFANGSWQDNWLLHLLVNLLFYLVVYSIWLLSLLILFQVFDLGVKRFFQEKCWIYRTVKRVYGGGKGLIHHFIESIKTIDLGDKSDQWLLKIVGLNFIILFFCCMLWFWGVFALVVYSVILFFILRKYRNKIKKDYSILQKAVSQMAEGNLQMDIPENLGLFEPMKAELAKVNSGFKKAVEEEIKSQNMKTELITNVSHDLKTPLTAIITYVNLLKEENITPEERKSYVDILDKKSLRLKKLIEDLFEVSKAASGNIKVEKTQIDLAEMVHQAAVEQEDRIKEAGLECRVSVPETKVLMMLDGEKTYRILENLLVNVSKYAMPGTRAWLSLTDLEDHVEIVVKNISAAELPEDVNHLTERFIRGDQARNTEGSGLGLAIVESFTKLQGGSFTIQVDGDLFKAMVQFPK